VHKCSRTPAYIMLNARLTKLPATKFWDHTEQSAQNHAQMVVSVVNFAKHE